MRRSSSASAPGSKAARLQFHLEELEARDVPSSGFSPEVEDLAYIDSALQQLPNAGDNFQNSWIVSVNNGADGAALAQSVGARQVGFASYIHTPRWQFVSGANSAAQLDTLKTLERNGQVSLYYPEINRQRELLYVPNDPFFNQQWHLQNTGQTGSTTINDVNATAAWDLFDSQGRRITGEGVVVAVIDSGVDYDHPDLKASLFINPGDPGIPFVRPAQDGTDRRDNDDDDVADTFSLVDDFRGWDFIDDDNDPLPDPSNAADPHGTAVAGLILAKGDNGIGVTGVAYDAKFTPVRLINGSNVTDDDISKALTYLKKYVSVSNNSWGITNSFVNLYVLTPQERRAIRDGALTGGPDGKGISYVFSAGNDGQSNELTTYSGYTNNRYSIAVAALDHNANLAFYSSSGASTFVSAPAGPAGPNDDTTTLNLTTTDMFGANGYNDGTNEAIDNFYTSTFNGTSAAAPLVSGVIALMKQANPNLTYRDVQAILAETARQNDPSNPSWFFNGAEYHVNPRYGFGEIDAAAAVARALTWTNLTPEITHTTGLVDVNTELGNGRRQIINGVTYEDRLTRTVNLASDVRIEWATLTLNVNGVPTGDLDVSLTSPSGLTVQLAINRVTDTNLGYSNYTFQTPFFWGEDARGDWTVTVRDALTSLNGERVLPPQGSWEDFTLNFYGSQTASPPISPSVNRPALPDPVPGLGFFLPGDTGTASALTPSNRVLTISQSLAGRVDVVDGLTGAKRFSLTPYGANFVGGISVAMADVNGDGTLDIITGAGPGAGPHVKVFSGLSGGELMSFFAYAPTFAGGVNVAGGDINGDGFADVIVAAGNGGGPHIRVISGRDGSELRSFMAFDPNFRGGSTVASGDVNGDGRDDIFVGAGLGGGPHVYVIDGATNATISTFFAFDSAFRNGVNVAAGDVTGDGLADLIAAPGLGGGPLVRVFDIAANSTIVRNFLAYDPNGYDAGLRVTSRDLNGDRVSDIITAPGPGNSNNAPVRVFSGTDTSVIGEYIAEGFGIFVG